MQKISARPTLRPSRMSIKSLATRYLQHFIETNQGQRTLSHKLLRRLQPLWNF